MTRSCASGGRGAFGTLRIVNPCPFGPIEYHSFFEEIPSGFRTIGVVVPTEAVGIRTENTFASASGAALG